MRLTVPVFRWCRVDVVRALLVVVFVASAPWAAAQLFPELAVGGLEVGSATGIDSPLSIASDGDGFLTAGFDHRSDSACYATRIDRDGTVLDRFGIRLPVGSLLSFDGSNYIAFDGQSAVRVSRDGRILDTSPRRVVPEGEYGLGLASAAGRSAVIHRLEFDELFVSIFDGDLEPLHETFALEVHDTGFHYFSPFVQATTDGKFVVFLATDWPECPTGCPIFVYLIDPAEGRVTRRLTLASSPEVTGETIYAFAVGPSGFAAASLSYESISTVVRSWDFDGGAQATAILDRPQIRGAQRPPYIIADGSGYLVSFETFVGGSGTNRIARLDAQGHWDGTLKSVTFDDGLHRNQQRIAWSGSRYLVTYWRSEPGDSPNHDVVVSDRPDEGRDLTPLSESPVPQQAIALASSGGVRLALWSSGSYQTRYALHATRLSEELRPLDPDGITVAEGFSGDGLDLGVRAAVAPFDGGFLIAWQVESLLYVRRLSVAGEWIDPAPRLVDQNSCSFTSGGLAASGTGLAIVYATCDPVNAIVFRRIEPGGMTIGPAVSVGPPIAGVANPMIAGDGETHLVVWQYLEDYQCPVLCPTPDPQLRAARVTREGLAVGSSFDLTSINGGGWRPSAMTWTGSNYLVVWEHGGLRGLRVSPDGSLLDSSDGDLLAYDAGEVLASLAFDGRRVELLWSETAVGSSEERLKILSVDPTRPLAEQRVSGELGWLATGLARRYRKPTTAMIATGPGRLALLYSRVPPELEAGGTSHVFVRELVTGGSRRAVRR